MAVDPPPTVQELRALGARLVQEAKGLDPCDPEGERLSARELTAATEAAADAVREWVHTGGIDITGAKQHLYSTYRADVDHGGATQPTFSVSEALTLMHKRLDTTLAIERGGFAEGPRSLEAADLKPAGPVTPSPAHWEDARFYFVMVDRFANGDPTNDRLGWAGYDPSHPAKAHGGDIRGLIDHLDYIQGLGCNALWINPVAQNYDAYHGYATIHGLAVDPARGSADELRELIDECHRRGMYVVLDVVANHTAPVRAYPNGDDSFSPTRKEGTTFRDDRPPPLPVELRRTEAFHDQGALDDWNDPVQSKNGDFPGGLSDLNTEDPATIDALTKTFQWWIARFDIDGYRVDTVKHAPKAFWDRFNAGIIEFARSIGKKNFLLFPEVLEGNPEDQAWATTTKLSDGSVHHAGPLNHPLFFALKEAFTGRAPGNKIPNILRQMAVSFENPNIAGNFSDSHDFARFLHEVEGNTEAYEAALATVFAAPGIPIVYYGSEQGFSGGGDPWNREDMFKNPALLYRTVPKPGEDNFDPASPLYATIQKLNRLRAKYAALRTGTTEIRWERSDRPSLFAFARKLPNSEILFAANPTPHTERAQAIHLDWRIYQPGDRLVNALHPDRVYTVRGTPEAPTIDVTLKPYGAAMLVPAGETQPEPSPPAMKDRPVIYQLLVRTFGNVKGTNRYNGDIETNGVGKFSDINDAALGEIKRQGHTHVYLSGVLRQATATDYSSIGLPPDDPDILKGRAGSPWAVKDYFDVSPDFADDPAKRLDEFKALIARIKAKGLKVMIDLVPNHVARSYHSVVRPDLDFGANDDQSKFFDSKNNFFYLQSEPGRGLTIERDPSRVPVGGSDKRFGPEDGSAGHTPRVTGNNRASYQVGENDWCETVKLNYGFDPFSGEARFDPIPDTWLKMDEVIRYWQEMGVEGFRVDYAHIVPLEFWRWATARAKARNPDFAFVGEAYEKSPDRVPGFSLKKLVEAGFDGVYHAELFHGLREIVVGPKWANDIDAWLGEHADIDDHLVRYAENHDEPRIAAAIRPGDTWNSGLGDAKAGRPVAATLFLTGRGPNLLYNGQDVGEPAEGAEGFGGDDSRTTIFDYWTMPVHARWVGKDHSYDESNLTGEQRALRAFYQQLNSLATRPPFSNGTMASLQAYNRQFADYGPGQHVYSFVRYDDEGHRALVVVNFSPDQTKRPTVRVPAELQWKMGIGSDDRARLTPLTGAAPLQDAATGNALADDGVTVELEPFGVAVFRIDDD